MATNPGRDSLETQQSHLTHRTRPHAPYGVPTSECMRAVVVVVVFCFYCVVSCRLSHSLSITSTLVVESGLEPSRPLTKTGHIPQEGRVSFRSIRSVDSQRLRYLKMATRVDKYE